VTTLNIADLLNVAVEWREDPTFWITAERCTPRSRWAKEDRDAAADRDTSSFSGAKLERHTGTVIAAAPDGKVLVLDTARKALHVMPVDCVRVLP
jgi:hypothetical protein